MSITGNFDRPPNKLQLFLFKPPKKSFNKHYKRGRHSAISFERTWIFLYFPKCHGFTGICGSWETHDGRTDGRNGWTKGWTKTLIELVSATEKKILGLRLKFGQTRTRSQTKEKRPFGLISNKSKKLVKVIDEHRIECRQNKDEHQIILNNIKRRQKWKGTRPYTRQHQSVEGWQGH